MLCYQDELPSHRPKSNGGTQSWPSAYKTVSQTRLLSHHKLIYLNYLLKVMESELPQNTWYVT